MFQTSKRNFRNKLIYQTKMQQFAREQESKHNQTDLDQKLRSLALSHIISHFPQNKNNKVKARSPTHQQQLNTKATVFRLSPTNCC